MLAALFCDDSVLAAGVLCEDCVPEEPEELCVPADRMLLRVEPAATGGGSGVA